MAHVSDTAALYGPTAPPAPDDAAPPASFRIGSRHPLYGAAVAQWRLDRRGRVVSDPGTAAAVLRPLLYPSDATAPVDAVERLALVVLDSRNRVMSAEVVCVGSTGYCIVDPGQILTRAMTIAVAAGAAAPSGLIIGHNHPSGDPTPSAQDYAVTGRLTRACQIIGWRLCDSLVLTAVSHTSIAELGRMEG